MMNQARGYSNYMQIASAVEKQQEIELGPMKNVQLNFSPVYTTTFNLG